MTRFGPRVRISTTASDAGIKIGPGGRAARSAQAITQNKRKGCDVSGCTVAPPSPLPQATQDVVFLGRVNLHDILETCGPPPLLGILAFALQTIPMPCFLLFFPFILRVHTHSRARACGDAGPGTASRRCARGRDDESVAQRAGEQDPGASGGQRERAAGQLGVAQVPGHGRWAGDAWDETTGVVACLLRTFRVAGSSEPPPPSTHTPPWNQRRFFRGSPL
jgi:hypothetical protein